MKLLMKMRLIGYFTSILKFDTLRGLFKPLTLIMRYNIIMLTLVNTTNY